MEAPGSSHEETREGKTWAGAFALVTMERTGQGKQLSRLRIGLSGHFGRLWAVRTLTDWLVSVSRMTGTCE